MSDTPIQTVPITVFASGRGSNFRAVYEYLRSRPEVPARIVLCVSNNPKPGAFEYARRREIPTVRLSPKMFPDDPAAYERELLTQLRRHGTELILLAGYMRKLPPGVVEAYRGRILNVHPALLPDFGGRGMYGLNVHRAVLEAGRAETGVTVHLVDEEYDTGRIVAQERIPVRADDTPESLAERVLALEHDLLPRVVAEAVKRIREGTEIRRTGGNP